MAGFNLTVKVTQDNVKQVMDAINLLASSRVMVGVPAENAFRAPAPGETKPPPNNAQIAYINEFGEPAARIPPRPFLVPAMTGMIAETVDRLKKAAGFAAAGRADAVDKALHALGLRAQSAVRNKITDGPFVPLSPRTVYRRQHRKAPRFGTKPLIDYGHLRRSITYVIRRINRTVF